MQFGNKAVASYSNDANRFRLQAMQVVTSTGPNTYVLNLAYRYDAVGNVAAITDSVGVASTEDFTYDALNRLTDVSVFVKRKGNHLTVEKGTTLAICLHIDNRKGNHLTIEKGTTGRCWI